MTTRHPIVAALYDRFADAPAGWVRSPDGRRLLARSLKHVRAQVGRAEAWDLLRALTLIWTYNMACDYIMGDR